jgi:hypothetical protein
MSHPGWCSAASGRNTAVTKHQGTHAHAASSVDSHNAGLKPGSMLETSLGGHMTGHQDNHTDTRLRVGGCYQRRGNHLLLPDIRCTAIDHESQRTTHTRQLMCSCTTKNGQHCGRCCHARASIPTTLTYRAIVLTRPHALHTRRLCAAISGPGGPCRPPYRRRSQARHHPPGTCRPHQR